MEFLGFHACIFAGLASFVLTDQGGLVALWGIWGEVTAALMGLESFVEHFVHWGDSSTPGRGYFGLCLVSSVCFVIQRPILISALLVITIQQFAWSTTFVVQTFLLAGILFYNVDFIRHRFDFLLCTWRLVRSEPGRSQDIKRE